jgi:hypothetical protein
MSDKSAHQRTKVCSWLSVAAAMLLLVGCASTSQSSTAPVASVGTPPLKITAFSSAQPGTAMPGAWQLTPFTRFKKPTDYRLVNDGGKTVLTSQADSSASLVVHPVQIDLKATPWLSWQWKVDSIIKEADNAVASREDSPARLIIGFEGDRDQLDFMEKVFHDQVKMISGVAPPFATLMYIWEYKKSHGEVVDNVHTSRVKMVVAQNGKEGVGEWRQERWNVYEDFKRAFNEEPPLVKFVAVMSDSDNTRSTVRAYFGDIGFTAGTN